MISQTSEYALRAVVHLAQRGDTPAVAQDISEATKVPVGYLHKILRQLARAGILTAQRGVGGGFMLARVPSAISILDILRATDNVVPRIKQCPLGIKGHTHLCSLHRMLDEQIAQSERVFSGTSIASLTESRDHVRPLCDPTGAKRVGLTVRRDGGSKSNIKSRG